MFSRLRVHVDRARESLFFVPALYVGIGMAVAWLMVRLDARIAADGLALPALLQSTPASARVLLSTIAGATITVAGVIFAVTLVSIQLASSQFSPRVIPGFLSDPRQQHVMGLVVGTFTYCLLVLSIVREAGESGALPVIPHLSSYLAVALSVVTILALIAFLDRSAQSMQVGEIVHRVTKQTCRRIAELYPHRAHESPPVPIGKALPTGPGFVVRAEANGWVRHIDVDDLLAMTPESGVARLEVRNGTYLAQGRPVVTFWPSPDDGADLERRARNALVLGTSRTLLLDVAFGIRQLVDIGLRALSPGINDPTTAYDVIVHLGIVLRELLWRDLGPVVRTDGDRRLIAASDLSHGDYVNRAFDQVRLAGAAQSALAATLMDVLGDLAADLDRDGLSERAGPVRRQGRLVLATYAASHPLPEDLERVRALGRRHGFDEESGAAGAAET